MDMQSKAKKLIEMIQTTSVEWKPLGEVGLLVRGNGLQKKDFTESGVPAIHYGQIYTYYGNQTDKTLSFVSPELAEKLKKVDKGDVVITNTSENIEDVGKALLYLGEEQAVTGGHATIFKPSKEIVGKFFVYFTQTEIFDKAKRKFAKGTKVIDVSATDMAKIQIPIPPLEIQQKIVKILDKFTELEATLEATLEAELALRKHQYRYYRDFLLDFDNQIGGGVVEDYKGRLKDVAWKTLGEVCKKIYSGGTPKTGQSEYWENGTIPWMSSGEVNLGTIYATEKFISDAGLKNSSAKFVPENSIVMALAGQGKTRGKVARTRISLTTNQSLAALVFNTNMVNPDYAYHFLNTQYEKLREISSGEGVRGGLNLQMISNYKIPIPPLPKQEKIAAILDKFDTLTHSISEGLPHEIVLRRKQYEYYREQLLAFPKAA